jgi:acyl-CoA synthetase (AMP-forming)/AMP-acid ligase II
VGATLVLPGRQLDGASLVRCMNRHQVSFSLGVPTVWQAMLDYLDSSGERLTTLMRVTVGGSACPASVFARFADRGIQVSQGWGMTETSPIGSLNVPSLNPTASTQEQATRDALKQGRAPFGVDLRVINDTGQEQPWDGATSGSLQIRGHWVTSGYAGEANSIGATADGWFTTGDIACIDAQGLMKITDRTKDIIKSGGEWISSIALENFAAEHPAVAQCAAIAARHPKWGERPLLLCTARPGTALNPADVLAYIASRVPRWWIPDALIVLDDLPRTATGKILKAELRSRFGGHLMDGSLREGIS